MEILKTARWAQRNIHVRYANITAVWNIEGKSQDSGNPKATVTYVTDELNAYKTIKNALNLSESKIYKTIYENGDEKKIIDKEAILLVQQKQKLIRGEFRNWIWADPDRRKRLGAKRLGLCKKTMIVVPKLLCTAVNVVLRLYQTIYG